MLQKFLDWLFKIRDTETSVRVAHRKRYKQLKVDQIRAAMHVLSVDGVTDEKTLVDPTVARWFRTKGFGTSPVNDLKTKYRVHLKDR